MLGRALRSADWAGERDKISNLTEEISATLASNAAIEGMTDALSDQWGNLHKGSYFADPSISFGRSELENLLRHLSVGFTPGHGEQLVDFTRLSDGQQSILYLSIVLGMHQIGSDVLSGKLPDAFDIDKLRPAVFTLIALEEPENSLSPHYLGRVVRALEEFAGGQDAQAVLATHSPSLMRRVPPEAVRYMRLDEKRTTVVRHIELPEEAEAHKFVREAVQAFPELYFSRFVVLGEGDSEEVVLPRLLAAEGILADDASISVVPLGGRHVNHFWRLLHGLGYVDAGATGLGLGRTEALGLAVAGLCDEVGVAGQVLPLRGDELTDAHPRGQGHAEEGIPRGGDMLEKTVGLFLRPQLHLQLLHDRSLHSQGGVDAQVTPIHGPVEHLPQQRQDMAYGAR